MDAELKLLLDERAINVVMQTYCHAMDYGPVEKWVECFTDDGVFDVRKSTGETFFRIEGAAELIRFITAYPDGLPEFNKHLYLSPLFDVRDDVAYVESYVFVIWCDASRPAEVSSFGKVNDVFVRTEKGWRIKERIALTEAFPVDTSQLIDWPASE